MKLLISIVSQILTYFEIHQGSNIYHTFSKFCIACKFVCRLVEYLGNLSTTSPLFSSILYSSDFSVGFCFTKLKVVWQYGLKDICTRRSAHRQPY
jgi:hypothetical protein